MVIVCITRWSICLENKASKRPLLSPLSISWAIEKVLRRSVVVVERGRNGHYTEPSDEHWEIKRG